jgi:pyruvate/2-oxoglutarate dehydrogenase complex dihydrolipoamide acyltransferase (E2) component
MSNELEARVARLERTVEHALGASLAEHDDADQAAARAKQVEADQKDAAAQAEKAEKARVAALAGPNPDPDVTDAAWELAQQEDVDIYQVVGTGADGRITVDDVRAAAAAKGGAS